MAMIELSLRTAYKDGTIAQWVQIDHAIRNNIRHVPHLLAHWENSGYEGFNHPDILKHFGMTRVYRDDQHIKFVFTEEQYVIFLLKWT